MGNANYLISNRHSLTREGCGVTDRRGRRKSILIFSFLIFLAWMCRFPMFHVSVIPYIGAFCGLLRPLIYMGICAAWGVSVSQKIINRPLRRYLELMAACCILWLFFRTVKYELTYTGSIPNLILPYCYYLPFILMPTFAFLASLHSRKGEYYKIPEIVSVPILSISSALILFVFTGPLHRLFWTSIGEPYSHGPGYFVVMGWIAFLMLMTMVTVFVRAKIPKKPQASLLPLLMLFIIAIYVGLAFFFPKMWEFVSKDYTSFFCIAFVGLMQACIASGMISSNTGYAKIFEAADREIFIMDDDRNIRYSSGGTMPRDTELLKKTEAGALQTDEHTLLKGCRLHPGHVVWAEDISALSSVLAELEQNRDELSRKNELETEMRKTELALSRAQEKNRLYDTSWQATAKQNRLLHEALGAYFDESDESRRKELLATAAVLGAYIKRKGNLIFAGDGGSVTAQELKLCFNESLGNAELLKADCYMDYELSEETVLPTKAAMCLYDSYEVAVEAALPDISFVFLRIRDEGENIRAIYSIVSPKDLSAAPFPKEVNVSKDEDTWIVSLSVPKGGGRL